MNRTLALTSVISAGLSACSLYDPTMTAAWEEPIPATPDALGDGDAPVSAALFAHPADEEAANLLALEREDPIPILRPAASPLPSTMEVDTTSVPEAIASTTTTTEIPVPEPPTEEPVILQPPVIVAGSGVPDPGSIDGPPNDPEVAEIRTETLVPATSDPFEIETLTLDPVFDSPPSMDYGVKLSEESSPMATE